MVKFLTVPFPVQLYVLALRHGPLRPAATTERPHKRRLRLEIQSLKQVGCCLERLREEFNALCATLATLASERRSS